MNKKYMVSVCMTTYYHERFIAKAIDSVLSQKVDFLYEIIICDDCSKDRTVDIIRSYAEKYKFIKYKTNEKNYGLTKNVFQAKCMCTGKYIVQLSGDDYWIDDNKLQSQVDFLEKNLEYIGVATRIETRTGDSEQRDFVEPKLQTCNRDFTIKDYLKGKNFPTNGLMMRNVIEKKKEIFSLMPKMSEFIDDETDCLLILTLGKIFFLNSVTVAYRRRIEEKNQHNFNSINTGVQKLKKHIDLLNNLYNEFGDKYDLINRYVIAIGPQLIKGYKGASKKTVKDILKSIPEEYKKRGVLFKSMLYVFPKTIEVVARKYRK